MSDRHQQKPYPLRMPEDLRSRLDAMAKESGRSMNAEIVAILQRATSDTPAINGIGMRELFEKLEQLERFVKGGGDTAHDSPWPIKPKPDAKKRGK